MWNALFIIFTSRQNLFKIKLFMQYKIKLQNLGIQKHAEKKYKYLECKFSSQTITIENFMLQQNILKTNIVLK